MNRSGRLSGYEYRIESDGVYFRREATPPLAWTRASNFGMSIVDDGEVIDGQAWHTFRFEMDGVTVDKFLSRGRLWDIQRLATEALGARAVVFVIRGAKIRIQCALYACWLWPIDIEGDNEGVTGEVPFRNIPERSGTPGIDGSDRRPE